MNENQLIIVLDSSVQLEEGLKVGPAVCFWLAYIYDPNSDNHPVSQHLSKNEKYKSGILMEAIKPKVLRSGAIYNSVDGPTKIFYDGIIRALEACYYLLSKEKVSLVKVVGDCEHAINQINGQTKIDKMEPMYNQVKKWEADYKEQEISISYHYISEADYSLYKKLDGVCKEIRGKIHNNF